MKTYFQHQKYLSFSLSEHNYFSQSAFAHPVLKHDPNKSRYYEGSKEVNFIIMWHTIYAVKSPIEL